MNFNNSKECNCHAHLALIAKIPWWFQHLPDHLSNKVRLWQFATQQKSHPPNYCRGLTAYIYSKKILSRGRFHDLWITLLLPEQRVEDILQVSIIIYRASNSFPKIIYPYVVALIIISGVRKDARILQSITPIRHIINKFGFAGLTQIHRFWYSFCLLHPPLVSNDIDNIIWWLIRGNIENKRWYWTKHIYNFQSKVTNRA